MFAPNVGAVDRVVRTSLGLALVALGVSAVDATALRVALVGAGVATLATAVLARCSIYYVLGFSTCPISGKPRAT